MDSQLRYNHLTSNVKQTNKNSKEKMRKRSFYNEEEECLVSTILQIRAKCFLVKQLLH